MDEKIVTIVELNYIATQIALSQKDDAITVEDVKSYLPDGKQEMADAIYNQMITNNLINADTHNLTTIETFTTQVVYVSDAELSAEDRAKRIEELSTEAHDGKLETLKTSETLLVDNFKIYFDNKSGITVQPISAETTINPQGLCEFLKQTGIQVDTINLVPQQEVQIDGDLGLQTKPISLSYIEYADEQTSEQLINLISMVKHIETDGHDIMLKSVQISEGEMDMRINQDGLVQNGDLVLRDGALYSFEQQGNEPTTCKVLIAKDDAVIAKDILGIVVPKEKSAGDAVLDDDEPVKTEEKPKQETPAQEHNEEKVPEELPKEEPQQEVEEQPKRTFVDWLLKRPPKVTVYTEETMYNPDAVFGTGTSTKYVAQEGSERAARVARTAAENEALKTAAEIKLNNLYAEKKRLKQMDKRNLFFPFRWLRNIIYAIAKPFVKNLGIFHYNKEMDRIKGQIKDVKDYYFNVEGNNRRYAKHQNVEFTDIENKPNEPSVEQEKTVLTPEEKTAPTTEQTTAQEQQTEKTEQTPAPQNPQKSLSKLQNEILSQTMPVGITAKVGNIYNKETNETQKNMVTLTTQKDGEKVEVVLPMKHSGFVVDGKEPFTKDELQNLWDTILTSKQIAMSELGKNGMSQEDWETPDKKGKTNAMKIDDLVHGKSESTTVFVNGIKTDIAVDGQIATFTALGISTSIPAQLLAENPLDTINQMVHQTAVNKYIELSCATLSNELNDSHFLSKVTANKVEFGTVEITPTNSGRPQVEIPINLILQSNDGQSETVGSIFIDTLTGEFNVFIENEEGLSTQDIQNIEDAGRVAKCAYANVMLSHLKADDIQNPIYTQIIASNIEKEISDLEMDEELELSIYGIDVSASREEGMVRIVASDVYGNKQEFSCFGDKVKDDIVVSIQEMGAKSMIEDQREYINKNVQIKENVFSTSKIGFGISSAHAPVHSDRENDTQESANLYAEMQDMRE